MASPTVLIDLTPLDTPSRCRGIGRYVRNLAAGLAQLPPAERAGMHLVGLTGLTWSGSVRLTEDLASFHGTVPNEQLSKRDHYRWAYLRRVTLWRAARHTRAALIHLGDPNATPLILKLAGCKRVVTCHDLIPLRYPDKYLTAADGYSLAGPLIIRRRYRSADHVVAISDATMRDVVSLAGVPRERVSRVYNGVEIERWSPVERPSDDERLEHHGLRGRRFLLYVGDTDWRKNVEGMMASLALARRQHDLDLVLAGSLNDAKVAEVRAMAARYDVAEAVRLLGYVSDEDLAVLFRKALGHVFVSRYEGFGFTLVEAMASGCPVITTRASSLGEVAGDAALLVEPEDHHQIGDAMVRLAADSSLREDLRQRGLARAPLFSVANQARQMVQVYRRVLGL